MLPIERRIFNKMLFCERIFEFIELEESLYFTALDVELHSLGEGDEHKLNVQHLLETNFKHLSAMSINLKRKGSSSDLGRGTVNPLTSDREIDEIVEGTLFQHKYASDQCYRDIANILFQSDEDAGAPVQQQDDIFSRLAQQTQESESAEGED